VQGLWQHPDHVPIQQRSKRRDSDGELRERDLNQMLRITLLNTPTIIVDREWEVGHLIWVPSEPSGVFNLGFFPTKKNHFYFYTN